MLFIVSVFFFLLPLFLYKSKYTAAVKIASKFIYNSTVFFFSLIFFIMLLLKGYSTSLWYNHLILSNMQLSVLLLALLLLLCFFIIFNNFKAYMTNETVDFILIVVHFTVWIISLFFINNLFSFFFVIEILSTCTFFALISSNFSIAKTSPHKDLTHINHNKFFLPYTMFESVFFFFWVSLSASLILYFILILVYFFLFTYDFYVYEYLYAFFITNCQVFSFIKLKFIFFFLL